jgi:ubiquinone/menaquinone biosynthesis C-methylase UbiE
VKDLDVVKEKVKEQFGLNAAAYVTSTIHSKGYSLERLVKLVDAHSDWIILDVATGTGHTALEFAPLVRQVIASDLTYEMLLTAKGEATKRKLTNIELVTADAEHLPIASGLFDLVLCRIAAHHFPDIYGFLDECARVLRPSGLLAIVDNIIPNAEHPGKQSILIRNTGRYVNAFEKLRDPSHVRCLSPAEWLAALHGAGFGIMHEEFIVKELDFDEWVNRMGVDAANRTRLEVMLRQAPKEVVEYLSPRQKGRRISFSFSEILLIGVLERAI